MFKDLTGEQWQLYTQSMKCDTVADKLNRGVRRSLKKANSREDFISLMEIVLMKYVKYGACDSEPRGVVENIADEEYNDMEW